jgi:hypothetical protein
MGSELNNNVIIITRCKQTQFVEEHHLVAVFAKLSNLVHGKARCISSCRIYVNAGVLLKVGSAG